MADYISPRPSDPLSYREDCTLRVKCVCGRSVRVPLRSLKQEFRLLGNMALFDLIAKLRCKACGKRPEFADVVLPGVRAPLI